MAKKINRTAAWTLSGDQKELRKIANEKINRWKKLMHSYQFNESALFDEGIEKEEKETFDEITNINDRLNFYGRMVVSYRLHKLMYYAILLQKARKFKYLIKSMILIAIMFFAVYGFFKIIFG